MKSFRIAEILMVIATLLMTFTIPVTGLAVDCPTKPVQIIVGFPPGGPLDLRARALAKAVKPLFPQPFTVVNKPGGGSVLVTNEVVNAKPDGDTLGAIDVSALCISPQLVPDLQGTGRQHSDNSLYDRAEEHTPGHYRCSLP